MARLGLNIISYFMKKGLPLQKRPKLPFTFWNFSKTRLISVSEIASVLKLIVEKYLKKWGATFPLMDLKMPLGRSTSRQGLLK